MRIRNIHRRRHRHRQARAQLWTQTRASARTHSPINACIAVWVPVGHGEHTSPTWHLRKCQPVCVCACACASACVCVRVQAHVHACSTCAYVQHMCMRAHGRRRTHMCICTCAYVQHTCSIRAAYVQHTYSIRAAYVQHTCIRAAYVHLHAHTCSIRAFSVEMRAPSQVAKFHRWPLSSIPPQQDRVLAFR